MPSSHLSTTQVAKRLEEAGVPVSRPTVIRWSDADPPNLPHYRQFGGKYRRYRPEVIDLLIQLWHENKTDIKEIRDKLFELSDQLAERDKNAHNSQAISDIG